MFNFTDYDPGSIMFSSAERRRELDESALESAEILKELAKLLEQEHEARIKAEAENLKSTRQANRLSKIALVISIITGIAAIFDVVMHGFEFFFTFQHFFF